MATRCCRSSRGRPRSRVSRTGRHRRRPAEALVEALRSVAPGAGRAPTPVAPSPPPPVAANARPPNPGRRPGPGQSVIRVDPERIDRLIDLVGELVINQAMLAQRVGEYGIAPSSNLAMGLDELEQLTREIQDSVMAIRAQPVKSVFQRMPRLVREVANMTGKQARLVMDGENTEVDKTVIERLSDPITHMLRNAIDHGLESPEERKAAGKNPEGVVRLAALHRSGRIVIEVQDDGKGINRERVLSIAVKKGLIAPDLTLTDEEIDNLIFLPGFSTADKISDVSGRGVGMDVVKRSVQALGGRISITSRPGLGSTFTLSLPLTLAVLDGMVVDVAGETLVVPLAAIVESLRPKPEEVRPLGPVGSVLAVRDSFVPLIDVGLTLGYRTQSPSPDRRRRAAGRRRRRLARRPGGRRHPRSAPGRHQVAGAELPAGRGRRRRDHPGRRPRGADPRRRRHHQPAPPRRRPPRPTNPP
jgi:two-component system chemotaxis sensor kinase CheA